MKLLRVLAFALLAAPLLFAQDWVEEGPKKAARPQPPEEFAVEGATSDDVSAQDAADAEALAEGAETPAESAESAEAPAPAEAPAVEEAAAPEEPAASPAMAAAEPAEGATQPFVHEVVRGDCLWNLAGTFYQNPFDWPRIYDANRSDIKDPDLIYPMQRFTIPGKTGRSAPMAMAAPESAPAETAKAMTEEPMAEAPEEETSAADADAQAQAAREAEARARAAATSYRDLPGDRAEQRRSKTSLSASAFVAPLDWEATGRIVGDPNNRLLISQGDTIFLNVGAASGLQPRMRGVVYRKGDLMVDPDTGDEVGYIIKRLGVIELTQEVTDNNCSAVVITSDDYMQVGDYIRVEQY